MDIAACVDKGFVMPTGIMAYSLCYNNLDTDIVFHFIIDETVKEKDKEDLQETISGFSGKQVIFYDINSKNVNHFPRFQKNGPTLATYYRLFLTEILPNTIDKILYLDGDIIVRKSLLPLWNTDLSNYAIAAAIDIDPERTNSYNRLNYDPCLGYFNAGVLLINLRYWREYNVINDFSVFIRMHYNNIVFHDQDVLNYTFRDKKLLLPIIYNLQRDFFLKKQYYKHKENIFEACKDPVIVHYSGGQKPWHVYIRYPHSIDNSFYKYQNQTKWKSIKVDCRPFKQKIKNNVADILRWTKIKAQLENVYVDIPSID